ncbi:hypothetical protein [Candidatus Nitrospira bockiana]
MRLHAGALAAALSFVGLIGCATTNEAEQAANRKLDVLGTTVSSLANEVRELKKDLRAQEKRQEEVLKVSDSLRTVVYSQAESIRRSYETLDRELKAVVEAVELETKTREQLVKDHQRFEQTMQSVTKVVESLGGLSASLEKQVQLMGGLVREGYKTELMTLKERLKILEGLTVERSTNTALQREASPESSKKSEPRAGRAPGEHD